MTSASIEERKRDGNVMRQYVKLASEIICRGIRENDAAFLGGEWCKALMSFVFDYAQSTNYKFEKEHPLNKYMTPDWSV